MNCRHCGNPLDHTFLDLGFAPPSNAYIEAADIERPEATYPLKILVCSNCWLVQTQDFVRKDELFSDDYAYYSSTSASWLTHAKAYCADMTKRLGLKADSFVIEIASNDGYLLKNFVSDGIPCVGIEPAGGTADASEAFGVPVIREFFGEALGRRIAGEGRPADLVIANNVYAHVPEINDFTLGMKSVLKPRGTITLEFPHLMRLIENTQFDTVYHEHFSYLSLNVVCRIFDRAGLRVFDVEELPTHGGSLRVFGCHSSDARRTTKAAEKLLAEEKKRGLSELKTYLDFQPRADRVKNEFLRFLIEMKDQGKKLAAYGAAAKGNTLLNYAGVKPDLLPYVCDAAPSKQGKLLPGSHIPILPPAVLRERRPDYVIIMPWNIANEVRSAHGYIGEWGGRFVVAVPRLTVFE